MTQFLPRVKIALDILAQIRDSGNVPFPLHKVRACSLSYAEQLIAQMKKVGLVKSTRGPGGGYLLMVEPHRISVSDIMTAVELDFFDRTQTCGDGCSEETHSFWEDMKADACTQAFGMYTLDELEEIKP